MSGTLNQRLRLSAALALALAGAACAPANNPPNVAISSPSQLVSQVVSQLNDAGRGVSVAIDKDGNPAVTYILATAVLKPGDIPPPVIVGQPQPPSVLLTTLQKGIWQVESVTPQSLAPAQGTATELVDSMGHALPGVTTSLAIDQQGTHHVVWSTPKGLFYSADTGGSFGSPQRIVSTPVSGGAVAVGSDGTPWVSFYSGAALRVARNQGGKWAVETVARDAGPAGAAAAVTRIAVGGTGQPIVAYGTRGSTSVATKATGGWTTQSVPGPGGLGLSLAQVKDGGALLTYYDPNGGIHLAQPSAGSWTVSDIASTAPGPSGQADPAWSTGLAVDGQGKLYVTWSDTAAKEVKLAMGPPGSLTPGSVPNSEGGTNPSLAVSSDGKTVAVAYYDSVNANLNVDTSPVSGQALAFQTPPLSQPTGTPPVATSAPPGCTPMGTTVTIIAPVGAAASGFEKKCYAAPANKPFTFDFMNNDTGVPHNVEVFTDSSATNRLAGATSATDFIVGPGSAMYRSSSLKAGTYYFHCDIHPMTMFGTFVVSK